MRCWALRSPRPPSTSSTLCGSRTAEFAKSSTPQALQVLDENHLVVLLVVDELVDERLHRQQAEASGAQPLLVADLDVLERIAGMHDRRMIEIGKAEARARISDPIHQQSIGAHARDADPPIGIELPTPFD